MQNCRRERSDRALGSEGRTRTNLLAVDRRHDLAMLESDSLDDMMLDFEEGEEVDLDPITHPEKSEVEELDLSNGIEAVREGTGDHVKR